MRSHSTWPNHLPSARSRARVQLLTSLVGGLLALAASLPLVASSAHAQCGNGMIDGGEFCDTQAGTGGYQMQYNVTCDDFPAYSGGTMGCTDCEFDLSGCTTDPSQLCGNGIPEPGELCDSPLSFCSDDCKCIGVPAGSCGNGCLDGAEQCDWGSGTEPGNSDSTPDACRTDCRWAHCGDGTTDSDEECDDGPLNANTADRCRPDCTEPYCGDGIVDTGAGGEECDRGGGNSDGAGSACGTTCLVPRCGNAHLDHGEVCDDGNTQSGDGCRGDCRSDETCGNGALDGAVGETCDDANTVGGDGCSASCQTEECGNGVLDPGEVCDDSNTTDGDGCSAECALENCGDESIDPGEECDDGGRADGDGCSADCSVENGYACSGAPSVCTAQLPDAGPAPDGGLDGGVAPREAGSSCAAGPKSDPGLAWLALALLAGWRRRRRR